MALVCAALAYGWWVTALAPFSAVSTVAVVGAGAAAMALGRRWGFPNEVRAEAPPGAYLWVVLIAVTAAWELAAYVQQPRHDHPTLSYLANAVLAQHHVRAAAFAGWLAGAFALVRR